MRLRRSDGLAKLAASWMPGGYLAFHVMFVPCLHCWSVFVALIVAPGLS
jgi:hypothetical protein